MARRKAKPKKQPGKTKARPAAKAQAKPRPQGPSPAAHSALAQYEAQKARARARSERLSRSGRDVSIDCPDVVDELRRQACRENFELFCRRYFPETFPLAWSDDHLRVIAKIEQAVLRGGLFAMAMPRGSGKTTLAEIACVWALLYGHRRFPVVIGSDEGAAARILDSVKGELEGNELLLEDFPLVCHPVRELEGLAQRAKGQLWQGQRTHIAWQEKLIVLPMVSGSEASGAIVRVTGITGSFRGLKYKRADGVSQRPDLVIVDDPQTDESAKSPTQNAQRVRILCGAVLGLAGPGSKISGIMPCTVIAKGDMADVILDRQKHPEWQGERTRLVYAWPTSEELWERYAKIRADGLREGDGGAAATEFYRAHQQDMDAGAHVAWPARHNPDELTAIQHAMNLKLDLGEAAFAAEYQNDPLEENVQADEALSAEQIAAKASGRERGAIPEACQHLVAFVDVQKAALFYVVAAFEDDFSGCIVDYGTYPKQARGYFTLRDIKRTLMAEAKTSSLEAAIYAGLESLTALLLGRPWKRDDGAELRIERLLIDSGWGDSTDIVHKFCRESTHAGVVMPSRGVGVTASSLPFAEYKRKRGDRIGFNWRVPNVQGRRVTRHVLYDTNAWKSFVMARLAVAKGGPGSLGIFGDAGEHELLIDHLLSEAGIPTEGRGRRVVEWKLRPNRDNHWLDGLVGCCVAASMQGATLAEVAGAAQPRQRQAISLAKIQQNRRGGTTPAAAPRAASQPVPAPSEQSTKAPTAPPAAPAPPRGRRVISLAELQRLRRQGG